MSAVQKPVRLALCVCLALACDEKASPPSSPSPAASSTVSESVKSKQPQAPSFEIDTLGPKVGFERALLDQRDGRATLIGLLKSAENFVSGQEVSLIVDRTAKLPWVVTYLDELGKLGVKRVNVKTETRKEYATTLPFAPELAQRSAPECSVVAMVLEDRGTAVWKLSGGVATKHGKGMAGPDLSMTGDNIERFAKGCKQSSTLFLSAGAGVEWGLAYDLAASAKTLAKANFDTFVLLSETPVPGHRVTLHH